MRTMRRAAGAVCAMLLLAPACRKGTPFVAEEPDLLRPATEWLKLEPVALLRDYIRIPTTAENGEEGLRAAVAARPSGVIVDRVLPGSMDGADVIRRSPT